MRVKGSPSPCVCGRKPKNSFIIACLRLWKDNWCCGTNPEKNTYKIEALNRQILLEHFFPPFYWSLQVCLCCSLLSYIQKMFNSSLIRLVDNLLSCTTFGKTQRLPFSCLRMTWDVILTRLFAVIYWQRLSHQLIKFLCWACANISSCSINLFACFLIFTAFKIDTFVLVKSNVL